jgi:ATP/maltotriose-dependent transcriptional regulator MalT
VILNDSGAGDPMLLRAAEAARAAGDQIALCDALNSLALSSSFQDAPWTMRSPLEEALELAEAIGYEDVVRWCLWYLAHAAFSAGDLADARAHGDRALAMMPGQDQLSRYFAMEILCLIDADMGAAGPARERAEANLEQSRKEGLRLGTGVLVHALGVAALAAGDLDRAAQWAASLYEHEFEVYFLAWHAQEILVSVALARGDSAQAKMGVERLLAAAEPLRNRRAKALAHLGLARALLLEGDDERAESVTHDALTVLMDNRWRPGVIDALDILAEVALFRGQHERAVRLTAAAERERTTLGLVAFPMKRERIDRNLAAAGAALGDERLETALQDGGRLSLQEAVAYAQRGRGEDTGATFGWGSLSPVERRVVDLASHGLNNPDIAKELFISRNTVKAHLSRAFAKLGVANRTELATLATRYSRDRQPR